MKRRASAARPGRRTRVLFVCTANQQRSPTAESLYSNDSRFEVKSAGTSPWAIRPVTAELIEWADWLVVMEEEHRRELRLRFPRQAQLARIFVLDIPDIYTYGDMILMREIRDRFEPICERELGG